MTGRAAAGRVAITGLGVVAPLGNDVPTLYANLCAGRSGVRRLAIRDHERLQSPIGATADFDGAGRFPPPKLRMLDRVAQFALAAAAQAVAQAGLEPARLDRERCGIAAGSGMGGAASTEDGYRVVFETRTDRVPPYSVLAAMTNAPAAWLGIEYGFAGPNLTYSTACSSGAVAIGEAARRVAAGDADVMIAGGAEAPLSFGVLRAWEALKTVADVDPRDPATSCRPFARTRSGLVLGEGAAFLVLEAESHAQARGARVLARVAGYGLATDCGHVTRPSVDGQARAMRAALRAAGLAPEAVGYVNAHGTATAQNDAVETAALKAAFGAHAARLPVSSTKSMHGHLLGAAGALEFVIAVEALRRRVLPPTMHLDVPDPDCDLDYVAGEAREVAPFVAAASNSFAFGGTNAVLVATAD